MIFSPCFRRCLEKAVRICDATFGNIYRWDGDSLHLVAAHNMPPLSPSSLSPSFAGVHRFVPVHKMLSDVR